MTVSPVGPTSGLIATGDITKPPANAPTSPAFTEVAKNLLQEANTSQLEAGHSLEELITGQVDGVHNVVLSMAKADLTFRLVLEIRNRLIESYQEIMRMQV